MDREATLDEFGRNAGESEDGSDGRAPTRDEGCDDGEEGHDDAGEPTAAESVDGESGDRDGDAASGAPITYEWRPGVDCEACGATVDRRWRDGDARVCAECKEW